MFCLNCGTDECLDYCETCGLNYCSNGYPKIMSMATRSRTLWKWQHDQRRTDTRNGIPPNGIRPTGVSIAPSAGSPSKAKTSGH